MKLGTVASQTRDGILVVVDRRGERFAPATGIAPTMQAALDDWPRVKDDLFARAASLDEDPGKGQPVDLAGFLAPLPRAFEWLDGSAYLTHVRLARQSRGASPPPDLETSPLMYQGGSGVLLPGHAPLGPFDPAWGLDFEAEIAVIVGDVPRGASADEAAAAIRLVCLVNDVTLRTLVPPELVKGFGFVQSKPSTVFAPFAVSPDALAPYWQDGRLSAWVHCRRNGEVVGETDSGEMHFSFPQLIAHAARTRALTAGTIIGSGTVSNDDSRRGVSCLVERRMRETIATGTAQTGYLESGETIRIEAYGHRSAAPAVSGGAGPTPGPNPDEPSLFGPIEQRVL